MRAENLLDAIGMVDDRYLQENLSIKAGRKKWVVLLAAVLTVLLTATVAMGVSEEFRGMIVAVFQVEKQETPPDGSATPGQNHNSGLTEIGVADFDGAVKAYYFTSDGIVLTREGGFYTGSRGDPEVPKEDAQFWQITENGVEKVETTRVDFPLTYCGRTVQIIFDYAIVNGQLQIKVWPQGMNEDPIFNGWNAVPVGSRTDVALLHIPLNIEGRYTADYLLLDLQTLETAAFFKELPLEEIVLEWCWVTDDLRYALLTGYEDPYGSNLFWLYDLTAHTFEKLDDLLGTENKNAYFIGNDTIAFWQPLGNKRYNIVRYHIPTGEKTTIIENVAHRERGKAGYRGIMQQGAGGKHGLLFGDDESVQIIDLRSGKAMKLPQLDTKRLTTDESPDGTSILISYQESNAKGALGYGYSQLGVLDVETGVLQMLKREVSGDPETFWGWIDNRTVVITSSHTSGGYYVYIYKFQ